MKPHAKLAATLVTLGIGLFTIERLVLDGLREANGAPGHIDGTLLSLMVLVPVALVLAGGIVFMLGAVRRR